MQGKGRHIEGFVVVLVLQLVVFNALADVGRHPDGVQHEVELSAQLLHRLVHQVLQVSNVRGIGWNDLRIALPGKLIHCSHAYGNGCIGEYELGTLFMRLLSDFPGDGLVVQGTKDQPLFSFKQVISHSVRFLFISMI